MSSTYVRDQITTFLQAFPTAPDNDPIDLTAKAGSLKDYLARQSISVGNDWLGVQFVGSSEVPQTIPATNTVGKFQELGVILLHIVTKASDDAPSRIQPRAEALMNYFRAQRINDILIESMTPPNYESGATLQFEGGWTSATINISYDRELKL